MTDLPMPAIAARKAQILRLGQQAVAHRGARRRARRHAATMVLLAAGATVLAYALAPVRIAPSTLPIATGPGDAAEPTIIVTRVATTPGLAATLAAEPAGSAQRIAAVAPTPTVARVETTPIDMADRLTDQQALALLKEAGTPAGIIRIGGRVTLVYHERPETDLGPSGMEPDASATLAALGPYRPM